MPWTVVIMFLGVAALFGFGAVAAAFLYNPEAIRVCGVFAGMTLSTLFLILFFLD